MEATIQRGDDKCSARRQFVIFVVRDPGLTTDSKPTTLYPATQARRLRQRIGAATSVEETDPSPDVSGDWVKK